MIQHRILQAGLVVLGLMFVMAVAAPGDALAEGAKHKLVFQVSSADPGIQNLTLNNVVNVQKSLGIDNVDIEVVAYGPGLSILTSKSKVKDRVSSLTKYNITFSACGNTMKVMKRKTGKLPQLIDGVRVVPAGVIRIMELQEQGYAYIRP